jgi:hypothetical protein
MTDTVKCDLIQLGRYFDLARKLVEGCAQADWIARRAPIWDANFKAARDFDESSCISDPGRYPWWKLEPEPFPKPGASLEFCIEAIDQLLAGYLSLPGNIKRWSVTLAAELEDREHESIAFALVELRRTKRSVPSIAEVLAEVERQGRSTGGAERPPPGARFTWRDFADAFDWIQEVREAQKRF